MKRKYYIHFLDCLAALSAVATLLSFVFGEMIFGRNESIRWIVGVIVLAIIVLICFLYANYQNRFIKKLNLKFDPGYMVSIFEGDLFKQDGVICIPVNEYFDTHIGDKVINPDSLHGRFIRKYFADNSKDLHERIESYLRENKIIPIETDCPRRLDGTSGVYTSKYELGTCVNIEVESKMFVLFALSHFNQADKAEVSRNEFTEVLKSLLNHLNENISAVNLPLFGTGLSRLNRSPKQILRYILGYLDFASGFYFQKGLNIVIFDLFDVDVNLLEVSLDYEDCKIKESFHLKHIVTSFFTNLVNTICKFIRKDALVK